MRLRYVAFTFFMILAIIFSCRSFAAASSDEKIEIGYDKENKCLVYSPIVTVATTGTKYRVIGFTARLHNYTTRFKMDQFDDTILPDGKVQSDFRIPFINDSNYGANGKIKSGSGNTIIQRFFDSCGVKSDIVDFFGSNNTLYLNAIMTIVEGTEPLADMDYKGNITKHNSSTPAQKDKDYFESTTIKSARGWKHPEDLESYFGLYCEFPSIVREPATAIISRDGSVITGSTTYADNETINLSGGKSDFPNYAETQYYKWEYKPVSSSSWTVFSNGPGKVVPIFPKLTPGSYNVKLTVWYGVGGNEYIEKSGSTQIVLNIVQGSQGAYVIAEPTIDDDKMISQEQIDSNATINIVVGVKGTLKNYMDISNISQWKNNLRKDPPGAGDQFQAFTYTTGLELSQFSQKTFTAQAGVLKDKDSVTLKFAVSSYATVNGQLLMSPTEYVSITLYKGMPPPPPVTNIPPVADISAPATVKVGDVITIFGTGSYDPDGTIVRYIWNVQGVDANLPEEPYGDVVYSKEGEYTILLIVVDDEGASGYTRVTITVEPPTPDAHFKVSGTLKEKRIVSLENSSSSPTRYPITATKNKWTITPVDGSGAAADAIYKVTNKAIDKLQVTGDPYTSSSFNGLNLPAALFSIAGQYDVNLTVTNTAGLSDTETQRITIEPDLMPVVKFKSTEKIYRETDIDGIKYGEITVADESYSPDGDFLSYRKIYAFYDANNNGIFGDAGDQTIVISETSDRNEIDTVKTYEYLTKEVGMYEVHVLIHENYIP